jgi:hypothetical protein
MAFLRKVPRQRHFATGEGDHFSVPSSGGRRLIGLAPVVRRRSARIASVKILVTE